MTHCFTIGYGGRMPDAFVSLLLQHQIRLVIDVRLRPDRASMGAYARSRDPTRGIEGMLARHQIGYLSLIELGNVFVDSDADWKSDYTQLIEKAGDLLTHRLRQVSTAPFALLCAEKRPDECHRLILANWLQIHCGWTFTHIE